MEDIYARTPVNKTAAVVTGQAGCEQELTAEQKRENLVAKVKHLDSLLETTQQGPKKKNLGKQKAALCKEINALRPKKKNPGIERYVMDILREDLSKFQFDKLMSRAAERQKQAT